MREGGILWQQYSHGPSEVACGSLVIKAVRARKRDRGRGRMGETERETGRKIERERKREIPSTVASKEDR